MNKFKKEIGIFISVSLILMVFLFTVGKESGESLWQISVGDCVTCGLCEVNCVKAKSAVVAVVDTTKIDTRVKSPIYLKDVKSPLEDNSANLVCPTGALTREILNDSTAKYRVKESLCSGCGKCVAKSKRKGNGAISLVIDPVNCLDCNTCSIAESCPATAVKRGN